MSKNLIINFHVIEDAQWFEEVLILLKSKFEMVDLSFFAFQSERPEKRKSSGNHCHISFDDGDRTFYTTTFPLLQKHNVPVSLFLSPKITVNQENFWFQEIAGYDDDIVKGIISKELSVPLEKLKSENIFSIFKCLTMVQMQDIIRLYQQETDTSPKAFRNMNVDEVLEVDKSDLVTIGAHTLNHPILKNETDDECEKEISGSISGLEKLLGYEILYFAYPNGTPELDFDEREIEILKKNKITIALSTESKYVSQDDSLLALPRSGGLPTRNMSLAKIKILLGPKNWVKLKSLVVKSEANSRKRIASLL